MKTYRILGMVLLASSLMLTRTDLAQTPSSTNNPNADGKPKLLVKAVYPSTAAKAGIGGLVKVAITIDERGNVIRAEAASGDKALYSAAVAAARKSTFYPKIVGGKSVRVDSFLFFNFDAKKLTTTAEAKSLNDANLSVAEAMENMYNEQLDLFKLVDKYPDAADILGTEWSGKYEKGDYLGAIRSVTEAIAKSPTPDRYQFRAEAYFQIKEYDNALKDINTSIEKRPGNVTASQYLVRGDIFKAQYNNVLAEHDYRHAIELEPKNEMAKQKLSSLMQIKNSAEVEAFQRDLRQRLEKFNKLKPVYEKKVADFDALVEVEKKKANVDLAALCQSVTGTALAWKWLDGIINTTSDSIIDLQKRGEIDKYFADATLLLVETSEMNKWASDTYLPGKTRLSYMSDKLGCKSR